MAKEKSPAKDKPEKIDAAAIVEFKAALAGEDAPTKPVSISAEDHSPSRKVPIQVETVAAAAVLEDADPLPEPPAEEVEKVIAKSSKKNRQAPPDMQHMQRAGRRPFPWGWLVFGLVLVAGASLAGFFVFNRADRFSGTKVQLKVRPTATVASGGTMTMAIEYQNLEAVDLVHAELAVEYPEGFTFSSATRVSSNQFNNAFTIGSIPHGQAGVVTITGSIIGAIDTTADFSATLTYRPANFNSDFQTKATSQVKITSSILGLTFDGPTKLAPGATGTWTISYDNTADKDLTKVQIEAVYPDQFTVTSTKPVAQERGAVWRLDTVPKNGNGQITITGTVNGSVGDSLSIVVRAGLVTTTNTVDLQDEQSLLVILVNTGLTTTVATNGATAENIIDLGDTVNYTIRVANRSDEEVNDITVAAALDGRPLNFSSLQNPMGAVVKNQTLTWTKKELAALALLKPGQEVALNFSVGTVPTLTVQKDTDINPHITATVTTSSPALPTNVNSAAAKVIFITKVRTLFALTAEARYYDNAGVIVGSGPLPPKVGQTTAYRINWSVTNTTNDAADMVVATTLPTAVFWTGQNIGRDAGDIAFDPTTREVRWTLNKVPAGTGTRLPVLNAHFEVSITPTTDQVGTVVVLTDISAAKATDSYTLGSMAVTAASLTTDLTTDPTAAGKGKVEA